ncbi:MAG: drug/metabolite exporter YedA [Planctomycetes bacterium]|nr:drug/metabolite exporter YedA [Planctomycetota bacterium]
MTKTHAADGPSTFKLVLAFAAIYIIWGSTYLAIKFVVEALPPFVMASARFLLAGSMLYAWSRWKGAPKPTLAQWRATAIIGGLLLCGGNGGVVFAEQRVSSGLTALIVATVPLWITLLDWLRPHGTRPTVKVVMGVFLGLAGIGILAGPGKFAGGERVDPLGTSVLIFATLSWSVGSIYSKKAKLPSASLLSTGMQTLAGGVLLLVVGSIAGEWGKLHWSAVTTKSMLSLAYLVFAGSLIGFTAYTWLLKVSTPSRVATYAYVNPVVAVVLGWLLAGEPMNWRTAIAAGVIVAGVVFITRGAKPKEEKRGFEVIIEDLPATDVIEITDPTPQRAMAKNTA